MYRCMRKMMIHHNGFKAVGTQRFQRLQQPQQKDALERGKSNSKIFVNLKPDSFAVTISTDVPQQVFSRRTFTQGFIGGLDT